MSPPTAVCTAEYALTQGMFGVIDKTLTFPTLEKIHQYFLLLALSSSRSANVTFFKVY